jgi:catecholate siderophore receptor
LPLGALLLSASLGAFAEDLDDELDERKNLNTVVVKGKAQALQGKDSLRSQDTRIGKGQQALRDIPQSITVVTERQIDDRELETVKETLKQTAGITFQAAEGGEEDIRLRGFALSTSGDIFVDGLRDPAFYDRDTFNLDRVEVLRGSASMLFGRGSTGGAVNLVNKVPELHYDNQVDVTVGSFNHRRLVADINQQVGVSSAYRVSAMSTQADNNGAGSRIDKQGLAASYRWGIDEDHEFTASIYLLDNNNGINYGMPWVKPTLTSAANTTTLSPLAPSAYYGMASDYNHGSARYVTLAHTLRFSHDTELTTRVRQGAYSRDQRASTIRTSDTLNDWGLDTVLRRGTQNKIQNLNTFYIQSDLSHKTELANLNHALLAGVDVSLENKTVFAARTAAQGLGGIDLIKPSTTVGTPNDGAWVVEASRVLRVNNQYTSSTWGLYAQDLVQVAPHWKLLGGLRYDRLEGNYDSFAPPPNGGDAPNGALTQYAMNVGVWSQRFGALYQPNSQSSYHVSAATSFNTSGDAYSLSAANQNTPPEKSLNLELGAKIDSADKNFSSRYALFQTTKLHERNTDPLQPNVTVLSGRRHAAGLEWDIAGRLSPRWNLFSSVVWMPVAKIDVGGQGNEAAGARPSLTPRWTASAWSTYQLNSQWRVGSGLNYRSAQTPPRNPGWQAPGFVTADLMAEYTYSDAFKIKANVTNLTNKLYADQLYSGHYVPGPGRLLLVTSSFLF